MEDIVAALQPGPPPLDAMGSLVAARDQLATQPARLAGIPAAEVAPEDVRNPAVQRVMDVLAAPRHVAEHIMGGLATLPQRAIQNSQYSLDSGNYDPAPTMEAAMLPMGTGAIAGVPVRAGEAVLGSGAVRGVKSGMSETIVAPAIHYDGNVFSGINHAHALDVLAQELKTTPEAILSSGKVGSGGLEGFLTSRGRYVDRQEGARIADAMEQTPHELELGRELLAEDLRPDAEHYSPDTRKLMQGGSQP